ncbi:MAG: sn-glycerol-3-phosphate ABC transporter ATP-binding protein UgpC [Candidatus Onthovivens sp.]|nr:sn-glycerol-3-phosphate ABC transporter ATP-binding protein UgpC [Candidatus Onthovivens sp.]
MKEKEKKETKVNKEEKEKVSLFKKIFKKDSKKDIINSAKKEAHEKALKEEIIIKNDFQKDIQFDEDAYVSLRHIDKIYDNKVQAVFDFNLDIQKQEFIVLVGPSGCGKSTTLRMIAGLEEISNGELYIDHVLSNDLAPKNRNIAMVFQNYALYPHMTVYDNLAFGLKMTHVPKDEIVERVLNAAKILGLEELLDRKPKALSGGQRQRVALGRAIVRNAKVFLMDEPLSNLDAKLRVQMRAEIIKLHDELKATTIYVTHDQTEAMTMASRIVVMNKGYIQQIGTPIEVYNKPANTFVASFIGAPAMNLLNVTYKDGVITFSDGNTLTLPKHYLKEKDLPEEFILGIRPENIKTTFKEDNDSYPVEIQVAELLGREYYVHTLFGGIDLVSNTEVNEKLSMHDKCFIKIDKEKLHFFNKDTQMRI